MQRIAIQINIRANFFARIFVSVEQFNTLLTPLMLSELQKEHALNDAQQTKLDTQQTKLDTQQTELGKLNQQLDAQHEEMLAILQRQQEKHAAEMAALQQKLNQLDSLVQASNSNLVSPKEIVVATKLK